jgi:hypothetical protein
MREKKKETTKDKKKEKGRRSLLSFVVYLTTPSVAQIEGRIGE